VFAPDREAYAQAAPSHDLPSNEAYNLAHHWTTGRCAPPRNAPAYVGSGSKCEELALSISCPLYPLATEELTFGIGSSVP
jgi:hypothetical protein